MFPKNDDMYEMLLRGMMGESPDSIIRSEEKQGQREFVAVEMLPKKVNSGTREQFEKMGIVFGKDVDNLFVEVTLPIGWKKVPTDHSMWSHLIDDKGRERASIFFKAAFYDRDAFMSIERRFSYSAQPLKGWNDKNYDSKTSEKWGVVKDGETIIWHTAPIDPKTYHKEWFYIDEDLYPECKKWLNEHYPNWEDPLAYWD